MIDNLKRIREPLTWAVIAIVAASLVLGIVRLVLLFQQSVPVPQTFLDRVDRRLLGTRFADTGLTVLPDDFAEAMDDDLAIPQALGVLHERVRSGNAALDDEELSAAATIRAEVIAMVEVLGINPLSPEWSTDADAATAIALAALVETLITDRNAARAAKDYAAADRIRDELAAAGITVEDGPSGSHWSIGI